MRVRQQAQGSSGGPRGDATRPFTKQCVDRTHRDRRRNEPFIGIGIGCRGDHINAGQARAGAHPSHPLSGAEQCALEYLSDGAHHYSLAFPRDAGRFSSDRPRDGPSVRSFVRSQASWTASFSLAGTFSGNDTTR